MPPIERELICTEQLYAWLSDGKSPADIWAIVRRRRWSASKRCTAADALNAMIDAHANVKPRGLIQLVRNAA
jgi:hypothetical protein